MSVAFEDYLKELDDPALQGRRDANGVDISLLEEALALDVTTRLRMMDRYARLLVDLIGDAKRVDGVAVLRPMRKVLEDFARACEAGDRERIRMLKRAAEELLAREGC